MIHLLDLKAQYASIKPELDEAVGRVLASGQYVLGPEVEAFEGAFARYCQTRHAIAVNSGTSALHLALLAAGVGPGSEVITTPFTFVATVSAICATGARPVFVDIDPVSFCLEPSNLAEAITPRTRAILPVHLYGMTADMDPILAIAREAGIAVIEDACQAHGALYRNRKAGSMGLSGCFSFYPGKNLGAAGEGGMVVTDDDEQAKTMRCLRDWGQEGRYNHVLKGFNYRMDAIQAAILNVKLRHLERWTEARRAHARRYDCLLRGSGVETPYELAGRRHVYHVYAVRSRARAVLRAALATRDVDTGLHYPLPVHLQKAYADLGYDEGDFPHAEAAAQQVLSLPLYPEMTERQIDIVAAAVRSDAYAAA